MSFIVVRTYQFQIQYDSLSFVEKERVNKIELELKNNPYYGKPLGTKFLREKKINEKRVYYLVYEDIILVLMVAISNKKTQKETINELKNHLSEYKHLAKELCNKLNEL